jgi:hypothetical protein
MPMTTVFSLDCDLSFNSSMEVIFCTDGCAM